MMLRAIDARPYAFRTRTDSEAWYTGTPESQTGFELVVPVWWSYSYRRRATAIQWGFRVWTSGCLCTTGICLSLYGETLREANTFALV